MAVSSPCCCCHLLFLSPSASDFCHIDKCKRVVLINGSVCFPCRKAGRKKHLSLIISYLFFVTLSSQGYFIRLLRMTLLGIMEGNCISCLCDQKRQAYGIIFVNQCQLSSACITTVLGLVCARRKMVVSWCLVMREERKTFLEFPPLMQVLIWGPDP